MTRPLNNFLFGAGASYGSIDCYPTVPPLGKDLFSELEKLEGVAASLSEERRNLFKARFETAMAELYENDSRTASALLREMCSYFSWFQPGRNNLYSKIIYELVKKNCKFRIATTNYDLLLEWAIENVGFKFTYPTSDAPDKIQILKIHGSCNFVPDVPSHEMWQSCTFEGKGTHIQAPLAALTPAEVRQFCKINDSISPAIAMYTVGKEIKICPDQIKTMQQIWKNRTRAAKVNFVIGLAVEENDHHIWDTLARSQGELVYIGLEQDIKSWAKKRKKQNVTWLGERFAESLPFILRKVR